MHVALHFITFGASVLHRPLAVILLFVLPFGLCALAVRVRVSPMLTCVAACLRAPLPPAGSRDHRRARPLLPAGCARYHTPVLRLCAASTCTGYALSHLRTHTHTAHAHAHNRLTRLPQSVCGTSCPSSFSPPPATPAVRSRIRRPTHAHPVSLWQCPVFCAANPCSLTATCYTRHIYHCGAGKGL